MSKLLTVYDDKEPLNNVLCTLTLNVDEAIYIYHHDRALSSFVNIEKVIHKYRDTVIRFIRLIDDEYQLSKILAESEDMIIDVGAAKYLSLLLFDKAEHRQIVYYDDEENTIKDYHSHKVIADNVFDLEIEDVLRLRGGEIIEYMHKGVSDKKTADAIITLVENNITNYPAFIRYMTKINSLINNARYLGNNTYELNKESISSIVTDAQFKNTSELFTIEENRLTFLTGKLREMVCVSGAFLENYLYIRLNESGYFDDVKMSAVIDFADEKYRHPVRCEIDCLLIKNNRMLFISCKSSKADTAALNEIYVHNSKFGNRLSVPVLCVLEELDHKYPSIYAKGEELGIYMVDRSCFENNEISDVFLSIINKTYQYDIL